jgi:hypothetical protein
MDQRFVIQPGRDIGEGRVGHLLSIRTQHARFCANFQASGIHVYRGEHAQRRGVNQADSNAVLFQRFDFPGGLRPQERNVVKRAADGPYLRRAITEDVLVDVGEFQIEINFGHDQRTEFVRRGDAPNFQFTARADVTALQKIPDVLQKTAREGRAFLER